MTTITALPTPPSTADPTNFNARANAFLAALPTFATETNTVASEVNANKVATDNNVSTATSQALIATSQASVATAASTAATTTANAAAWVNGNTYALNANAISQQDYLTYRKITASSVTTIDPKFDPTNWTCLSPTSAASALYSYQNLGGF